MPPSSNHGLSIAAASLALSDLTRWKIIVELSGGEPRMVSELAKLTNKSVPVISKHMAVLRRLGIVMIGRGRLYHLEPQFLPAPGSSEIDFGPCIIRLDRAK